MSRVIIIDEEFHKLLSKRVCKSPKILKELKQRTKDKRYYPSFEEATRALVPELQGWLK
jgi:hypothetical protein